MTTESILKGNWNELKGKLKEKWGELSDDDLERIQGKRDQLIGALQKAYGKARLEVERELADFEREHDLR